MESNNDHDKCEDDELLLPRMRYRQDRSLHVSKSQVRMTEAAPCVYDSYVQILSSPFVGQIPILPNPWQSKRTEYKNETKNDEDKDAMGIPTLDAIPYVDSSDSKSESKLHHDDKQSIDRKDSKATVGRVRFDDKCESK